VIEPDMFGKGRTSAIYLWHVEVIYTATERSLLLRIKWAGGVSNLPFISIFQSLIAQKLALHPSATTGYPCALGALPIKKKSYW
jgi:hypothetical protein